MVGPFNMLIFLRRLFEVVKVFNGMLHIQIHSAIFLICCYMFKPYVESSFLLCPFKSYKEQGSQGKSDGQIPQTEEDSECEFYRRWSSFL